MQNNLIDIGANLTHSSFDSDRKAIIEESFKQGIKTVSYTHLTLPTILLV